VCVALAASESLTNRTGRTATAVTVTFSEQVRVTSYDEGIFPTKEPSSRSETFRFSGGQLENGTRFAVSWTPSTAEITSTEWETPGVSAATSSGAASAPLTYEQIMAQIAQYPGPDEPLYQPKPDEQIWLTDLEGHADIYDNDSIKINYASGFDKSQITRIDVCRNGVKLGFVPTLFDVLTNEQMKTFDGDPAERTPKSDHTDHAIFGYKYEVRVWSVERQIVGPLAVRIRTPFKYQFGSPYAFLGYVWEGGLSGMSNTTILSLLRKLKTWGYEGVNVNFNCYVADPYSSTVFRLPGPDSAIADWTSFSASDEQLSNLLDLARQAGLETSVRMQLYVSKEWTHHTWDYSATIRPRDVEGFFTSYLELASHLAAIANDHGSLLFTPFTEMDSIGRETERVKRFYTQLAAAFDGELGFEESTNHYLEGWGFSFGGDLNTSFAQLAGKFWDWRDPAGRPMVIEWSCWTPPLETLNDQRLSSLLEGMVSFWEPALRYYKATYPGSRIRFGEIGTYNIDGIGRGGDYANALLQAAGTQDAQEVADIWAAYIVAAMAMELDGLNIWSLDLNRDFDPTSYYHAQFWGVTQSGFSPALAVISALLGGEWKP
jgi:hypothetical protein